MEIAIAVIEEYAPGLCEWEIVAWIGPDRTEGEIDFSGDKLRIRYLGKELKGEGRWK